MRDEAVARHMTLVRELSREGRPLSAQGARSTMSNPDWFDQDGPTARRRLLHEELLQRALAAPDAGLADQEGTRGQSAASVMSVASVEMPAGEAGGDIEGGRRRAVVIAGPPGAGKSTVRAQLLGAQVQGFVVVDADAFKDGLIDAALADGSYEGWIKPPEVAALEAREEQFFPLEMSALLQAESSLLARRQRERAVLAGRDIVVDTVLWDEGAALDLGRALQAHEYDVTVVDVEVDYQLSKERIAARWESIYRAALAGQAPRGGRWVPSEYARVVFGGPAGIQGPSLCEGSARALAEQCSAVSEYRLYRAVPVPGASGADRLATPAVLQQHRRRPGPGSALVPVDPDGTERPPRRGGSSRATSSQPGRGGPAGVSTPATERAPQGEQKPRQQSPPNAQQHVERDVERGVERERRRRSRAAGDARSGGRGEPRGR